MSRKPFAGTRRRVLAWGRRPFTLWTRVWWGSSGPRSPSPSPQWRRVRPPNHPRGTLADVVKNASAATSTDRPDKPKVELLTPDVAAIAGRVSTQTVLDWIESGRLFAINLASGDLRIPRPVLERFLELGANGAGSDGDPRKQQVPPELLEPRSWQDVLAEYEQYFKMTTLDMLALHVKGQTPELRSADDERMYEHWLGSARLAIHAGVLEPPAAASTVEAPAS